MADKKITDLQLIGAISDSVNFAVDNGVQTYRGTAAQIKAHVLATNAITAAMIQSNAVTTAKILDANVTRAKLAAGAIGRGYWGTARTSNVAVTMDEDFVPVDPSSAAFTLDLPTAASIKGRRFTIQHQGTTWHRACTLDPNSTETINGASTFKLCTPGETLVIESDDSNWRIIDHFIPSGMAAATTHTPGAVTTAPTFSTGVSYNKYTYWRDGRHLNLKHEFKTVNGGGGNGSGVYLWLLPQSLSMHSEIEAGAIGANYSGGDLLGNGFYCNTSVVNNGEAWAFKYDANNVFVLLNSNNNLGSAYGGLNNGAGTVAMSFQAKIKIADWEG